MNRVMSSMLVLIPMMTVTETNHTSKTKEDVIVTYSNHAEADPKPKIEAITEIHIIVPEKLITERAEVERKDNDERDSNEVVFVPNERVVERNEDYLMNKPIRMDDFMARRTVDDVMDNGHVRVETEPPADIIFLTGKNNENENAREPKRERDMYHDTRRSETDIKPVLKLNCTNLDCNSTVESICGGKIEHKKWRYRLFLNECYFRKVNCYFQHDINRYHRVALEKCQNTAAHTATRPSFSQLYPPAPQRVPTASAKTSGTRRIYSSRRSLSVSVDGKTCAHACPVTCQNDYRPECAVSNAGRRVFVNHCELDLNSCILGIVWHRRPLAECVGGKMADLQQNRGFIDWMQRVGIVDNRGRLVLA